MLPHFGVHGGRQNHGTTKIPRSNHARLFKRASEQREEKNRKATTTAATTTAKAELKSKNKRDHSFACVTTFIYSNQSRKVQKKIQCATHHEVITKSVGNFCERVGG
jgi:metal-responsive CopG/Arc/MetJ family transcriptional regulator